MIYKQNNGIIIPPIPDKYVVGIKGIAETVTFVGDSLINVLTPLDNIIYYLLHLSYEAKMSVGTPFDPPPTPAQIYAVITDPNGTAALNYYAIVNQDAGNISGSSRTFTAARTLNNIFTSRVRIIGASSADTRTYQYYGYELTLKDLIP